GAGGDAPLPSVPTRRSSDRNSSGASCADISGATNSTYTPVAGDVGSTLRVVETVSKSGYNNGGSTSAASPVVMNGGFTTNTPVLDRGRTTVGTGSGCNADGD